MSEPADRPAEERDPRRRRTRRRLRRLAYVATPTLAVSGMVVSLSATDDATTPDKDEITSVESDEVR